jgi:geranylgeranyl diphosphate synthase type I
MTTSMTAELDVAQVKQTIIDALKQTSLADDLDHFGASVSGGKMLRANLVLEVGKATGLSSETLLPLGAAVELLHAASLLHDDIIDGGVERRSVEALWVSDGMKAAILVGDLLLSVALGLVQDAGPDRLPVVIRALRDMCDAEAEQELSSGENLDSWEDCVRIARCKTGSLFGLAAACGAGPDGRLADALERAGYNLGTAYQLADDLLDVCPDPTATGKSLGTDAATGKLTAASVCAAGGPDPAVAIEELLVSAYHELDDWPRVQERWQGYVKHVVEPVIHTFTKLSGLAVG